MCVDTPRAHAPPAPRDKEREGERKRGRRCARALGATRGYFGPSIGPREGLGLGCVSSDWSEGGAASGGVETERGRPATTPVPPVSTPTAELGPIARRARSKATIAIPMSWSPRGRGSGGHRRARGVARAESLDPLAKCQKPRPLAPPRYSRVRTGRARPINRPRAGARGRSARPTTNAALSGRAARGARRRLAVGGRRGGKKKQRPSGCVCVGVRWMGDDGDDGHGCLGVEGAVFTVCVDVHRSTRRRDRRRGAGTRKGESELAPEEA